MTTESKGLKEVLEIFTALGEFAYTAGKVFKDDKVNTADLVHLPELVMKYPVFEAAVKDADMALPELKDLKEDEVLKLVVAAYSVATKFAEGKRA